MRRNEFSLIMVKPKFGYAHESTNELLKIPLGWETADRLEMLRTRRAFFEVELHDWTVRHDLFGNGSIIKTII
jgi:hypothetical protein